MRQWVAWLPAMPAEENLTMGFALSERVVELNTRLEVFMEEHIYPKEHLSLIHI